MIYICMFAGSNVYSYDVLSTENYWIVSDHCCVVIMMNVQRYYVLLSSSAGLKLEKMWISTMLDICHTVYYTFIMQLEISKQTNID